ncbi:MAG: FAD-dependent oxidoreductase, partial [Candidatus Thermoplasmatota archaeon]|nr:FAD-dependent oxidoreductase [Candidatus Thermoplasmatota archaeon]
MKEYDLIVLGSGAGMNLAANARQKNMRVAMVEEEVLGGTCLNRGCIPSKILIHPADIVREIGHAKKLGVHATIDKIDFQHIRKRMLDLVVEDRKGMERGVAADSGLDLYPTTGRFTGPKTIQAGKEIITAPKIFVATGARPIIPPIPGLEEAGFLTSKTVFDIKKLPSSIIIIGGGYIGCEFAHFFSSMGTQVVLLGQNPLLLSREEPEISHLLKRVMSENVDVRTNQDVNGIRKEGGKKVAVHRDRATGKEHAAMGEEILVAAGIMGNGDVLEAKKAGMQVDSGGYIAVNEYLETGVPGIWAFGDAIGKHMFRHTANYESQIVWNNAFREKKRKVDYHAVPHAVFTY